jgi:hypothetical protein
MMSRHVQEILESIIEEFVLCDTSRDELEAKAIFRLLNCCPPQRLSASPTITRTSAGVH